MRHLAAVCVSICLFGSGPARAQSPESAPPTKLTQYQFSDWFFHHNAGWKALYLNKLPKAEYCFNRAIEIAKIEIDADPRLAARSYGDLAWVLHREGRDAEAQPLAKWALSVREQSFGTDSMQVTQTMYTLAAIELKLNHLDEAEVLLAKTLDNCRLRLGNHTTGTAEAIEDLAAVHMIKRQHDKARDLYLQSLAIRSASRVPDPDLAYPLDGLATIELAEGKLDDAERHLIRIVSLMSQTRAFDPEIRSKIHLRLAEVYRKTNRAELADKAEADAKAILNTPAFQSAPKRADIPRYQATPANPSQPGPRR